MKQYRVALVHNVPGPPESEVWAASADVLDQVRAVEQVLWERGHRTGRVPFTRAVGVFLDRMAKGSFDVIFNLCETVDDDASLAGHPAAVFEMVGIPFTGSPADALMMTTDKATAKRIMMSAGIPTPAFRLCEGMHAFDTAGLSFPVIVKPRYEDGSIGIDQNSLFDDEGTLLKELPRRISRFGSVIVEDYIAGREFNVSLAGYPEAAVLPAAEIDFSSFPAALRPILGYRAKWDRESPEYQNSRRMIPADLTADLARVLASTARDCFRLFNLRDYGRVDLRLGIGGGLYVLDVNANPCLSPDAGLAAAFAETGRSYGDMILQILSRALLHHDTNRRS